MTTFLIEGGFLYAGESQIVGRTRIYSHVYVGETLKLPNDGKYQEGYPQKWGDPFDIFKQKNSHHIE